MKLLTAAIFLTSIAGILGLQCYTCTSGSGAPTDTNACGDPFNAATTDTNVLKTTCPTGLDVCAKTTASSGDLNLVARACYASAGCPEQGACSSGSFGGSSATICCCSGELCNAAGSVTVNIITTVAVIFMAMLFTL
ncbi:uncharacterized protein LOC119739972 [Patiria miniata]|uniref:UPAR/Ly6 domain-containing protein n=1 Tax=Patiria miniata TaxID=46514 RepID=A0A914B444_PATMI|nr:uncharacterized protein LOC119739972 [Patiria miniata]